MIVKFTILDMEYGHFNNYQHNYVNYVLGKKKILLCKKIKFSTSKNVKFTLKKKKMTQIC